MEQAVHRVAAPAVPERQREPLPGQSHEFDLPDETIGGRQIGRLRGHERGRIPRTESGAQAEAARRCSPPRIRRWT